MHRVRFEHAPEELVTEQAAPVRIAATLPRSGTLACEVSLWGILATVDKGLLGRAHRVHRWAAATVSLPPEPVAAGSWTGEAVLVPGRGLPPTALAPLGRVDYELNAVAVVDGAPAVANRSVILRSTGPASYVDTEQAGDGPWRLDVTAAEARLGSTVRGRVTIAGAGEAAATVQVAVEQVGDGEGYVPLVRWRRAVTLAEALPTGGPATVLPFEVTLPRVGVPTVVTDTFRERWRLVVTAAGPAGERRLVSGLVVRG